MQEWWSTPWALGHGPESPGTAGRPRGPSGSGPIHPGQLVDPVGPQTRSHVPREFWSNPRDLGPEPKLSRTAGLSTSLRILARVAWDSCMNPRAHGNGRNTYGTAGQPRGNSNPGPKCPGHLVNPAVPRTWVRVACDHWSTPQALVHGPASPGTAGRHRGIST